MPMPSNLFPAARGASGPANGGMGSSVLDGPPPSPVNPNFSAIMGQGMSGGPGAGPRTSRELDPEILMGLLKSGETIASMIDDMASMVPDLAQDLAGAKDLLLRAMAKLTVLTGGNQPALGEDFAGAAPLRNGPAVP